MKKYIFILLLFTVFSFTSGKVIADFPELLNPDRMLLGNEKLYIVQDFSVHIYSIKDYSLIKKVGKKGEGPGEFTGYVKLLLYNNKLYITSVGKITIFDRNGNIIDEKKSTDLMAGEFLPINDKFLGRGLEIDKDHRRFRLLNIYNRDLVKEKVMARVPYKSNFDKSTMVIFDKTFSFHVFRQKIYLVNGREFKIDVYDRYLEKSKSIELNYKRIKFSKKDKNKVIESLRANPGLKSVIDEILKRQRYPEFYPAISGLYDNKEYLFVMTYRWAGSGVEFMVFDDNGKFVKQLFIPFKMKNIFNAYPWDIKGDKFWQLIENEDDEWQLHEFVMDLK